MAFVSRPLRVRELGFDTIEVVTLAQAQALRALDFTFGVRYVETFTLTELETLTGEGIDVMLTGYARTRGWSVQTGGADGARIAAAALHVGFPLDATLWNDQEDGVPGEAAAVDYASAWWEACHNEGIVDPGIYVGAGSGFVDPVILHRKIPFRHYWRSFSQVPNVDGRGYQLLQLFPPNESAGGANIDSSVAQSDYLGQVARVATRG
jgi:hypothetical protein